MRILVTGGDGQLGSAIKAISAEPKNLHFTFIDIKELDLTNEPEVNRYFDKFSFDYIVNCAAYTAVDLAESQSEKAHAVNVSIPALLNAIIQKKAIRLIHISSEYVYDGSQSLPHTENEKLLPLSVYAKTKLEGEKQLWNNKNAIVIRTSWLYSEYGINFMKTMIRLSREKLEIGVVFDQTGTPTYAGDLAETIIKIIEFSEVHGFEPGIYNYSNEGVCSWYDFATEIMNLTGSTCRIKPIRTEEYPLPAKRPAFGVLDKHKIKHTFGLKIPYWKNSLSVAIKKLENRA
jgi:dTDP-4-dehydrorhamnose reductase